MTVDTQTLVSITEANQNFSKVARLVDEHGSAVILKNNVPRYLIIDFCKAEENTAASDEDVISLSRKIMAKNKALFHIPLCQFEKCSYDLYTFSTFLFQPASK